MTRIRLRLTSKGSLGPELRLSVSPQWRVCFRDETDHDVDNGRRISVCPVDEPFEYDAENHVAESAEKKTYLR